MLLDAGLLLVVVVVGKIAASLALNLVRAPGDRLLVGFGMLPRGEVGLIFATIGLAQGVLDSELYASLLLVVLVTRLSSHHHSSASASRRCAVPRCDLQVDAMPVSGWLWIDDDVVDLAANPPMEQQTSIALDAALFISEGARPGPKLLDWLGHGEPAAWEPEHDRPARRGAGARERARAGASSTRRGCSSGRSPRSPMRWPAVTATRG